METNNIGNTPIKCKGVVVAYCSSRRLKFNEYTDAVICVWNLGAILSHSWRRTETNDTEVTRFHQDEFKNPSTPHGERQINVVPGSTIDSTRSNKHSS